MQILYVEDDAGLSEAVQAMLRNEGHDCHVTALGRQAIRLAKRNDYDIIVVDIMLPDIDGYEVIGDLRAADVSAPILVQSSLLDHDEDPDALGFEVHEFLAKPFRIEELIERMETIVTRSKQSKCPKSAPKIHPEVGGNYRGRERRRHSRFATLKAAEIIVGDRRINCLVVNMSHGGAAIQLPAPEADLPRRFVLTINEIEWHDCTVRWTYRDKIGVKFI